ncbi:hypothetical protein M422DRAFT_164656 [Sphaerobolus stellatus SS14]|uniref:Cytochrome P450 n=1 Tax=Sphaerobolus stellatus (strain SS14) TaxID=990650 RepID=A0A0C9VI17_SPHS4|nr:hypothetical protein M422DRAFT_164656 [Sphaerobolus stellatus SS14]
MLSTSSIHFAFLSLILLAYSVFYRRFRRRLQFPGPSGLPFIGNVHQLPKREMWLEFSRWQKTYGGEAIQFQVLQQPAIVIHSTKLIKELLEKRAYIYSDRPKLVMAGELSGMERSFSMQNYGERWRNQRKLVAAVFAAGKVARYHSLQEGQARMLINNLISRPESLEWELKMQIGVIIIRLLYGYHIQKPDDPFLIAPLKHLEYFSEGTLPGGFLVDTFPQLKYLPTWFPGTGFHKTAQVWREAMNDACWNVYQWSKANLATGQTLQPNLFSAYLRDGQLSETQEAELVWSAYSVLAGGLDTNIAAAKVFFLAMVMHPEIQRRAQAEIDAVVGNERLPTINDRENLPYIRSIIAELFRWHAPGPLGFPRSTAEDDDYNGIFIKKGTTVFINVWHMLNDPEVYPSPETFNPDRYNNSEAEMKKVLDLNFGFGRRACVGVNFAMGTLYAIVLTTLATCDVLPGIDEDGKEIITEHGYTSTIISFPTPFKMRIRPRSPKALELLQAANISLGDCPEI